MAVPRFRQWSAQINHGSQFIDVCKLDEETDLSPSVSIGLLSTVSALPSKELDYSTQIEKVEKLAAVRIQELTHSMVYGMEETFETLLHHQRRANWLVEVLQKQFSSINELRLDVLMHAVWHAWRMQATSGDSALLSAENRSQRCSKKREYCVMRESASTMLWKRHQRILLQRALFGWASATARLRSARDLQCSEIEATLQREWGLQACNHFLRRHGDTSLLELVFKAWVNNSLQATITRHEDTSLLEIVFKAWVNNLLQAAITRLQSHTQTMSEKTLLADTACFLNQTHLDIELPESIIEAQSDDKPRAQACEFLRRLLDQEVKRSRRPFPAPLEVIDSHAFKGNVARLCLQMSLLTWVQVVELRRQKRWHGEVGRQQSEVISVLSLKLLNCIFPIARLVLLAWQGIVNARKTWSHFRDRGNQLRARAMIFNTISRRTFRLSAAIAAWRRALAGAIHVGIRQTRLAATRAMCSLREAALSHKMLVVWRVAAWKGSVHVGIRHSRLAATRVICSLREAELGHKILGVWRVEAWKERACLHIDTTLDKFKVHAAGLETELSHVTRHAIELIWASFVARLLFVVNANAVDTQRDVAKRRRQMEQGRLRTAMELSKVVLGEKVGLLTWRTEARHLGLKAKVVLAAWQMEIHLAHQHRQMRSALERSQRRAGGILLRRRSCSIVTKMMYAWKRATDLALLERLHEQHTSVSSIAMQIASSMRHLFLAWAIDAWHSFMLAKRQVRKVAVSDDSALCHSFLRNVLIAWHGNASAEHRAHEVDVFNEVLYHNFAWARLRFGAMKLQRYADSGPTRIEWCNPEPISRDVRIARVQGMLSQLAAGVDELWIALRIWRESVLEARGGLYLQLRCKQQIDTLQFHRWSIALERRALLAEIIQKWHMASHHDVTHFMVYWQQRQWRQCAVKLRRLFDVCFVQLQILYGWHKTTWCDARCQRSENPSSSSQLPTANCYL